MATNVNVGINVNTQGMQAANAQAAKLAASLQAAAAAAGRVGSATIAAQQGVTNSNAARAPSSGGGSGNPPGNFGSGLARGLGGQTGAEGRDFAKQAQGLGGLVHVYATFAANLFAVSAAFTALSKAADTTNLVKGLDQLGSYSGKALGSVAKQLSMVTQGAISLRDAMTATAQASAGGMTNATILRMGMVAKQASQALGVAMPDALSRLSRGITKIEPELLDEIGIMVRVDTASQNYARTLGKTASSLTDFEKRQGFANAVLEQGEKKFGALKLDANPYAKISASMANIAQTGLELINTVFKPIVSLLSSSPVALAGAMGLIAAALLKQALPALGMFKENMQVAADQARNLALARAVEAQKGYKAEFVASKTAAVAKAKSDYNIAVANAEAIAIAKGDILDDAEAKIKSLREKSKKGSVAQELLSKDLHEISAKDIARLDANAAQLESKALKQALAGNAEKAESLVKSAEAQRGYAEAIRHSQKTEADYFAKERQAILERDEALKKVNITEEAAAKAKLANRSLFDTDRQTQIIADRALLKSASQNIVSQAAQTAAVKGYSEAVKEAKEAVAKARSGPSTKLMDLGNTELDAAGKTIAKLEEVTTPAMGRMQGQWTLMKTRISAATSAIGTFMNAFGVWSFVIGAVVAGVSLLDSWLSKTEKEMIAANNALAILGDSLTNIDRVITNINGYGSIEIISSANLQASANAVSDLSDNLDRGLKAALAYRSKIGLFDSVLEGWKIMFGISIPDKVAKNITDSINKILQMAQPGPEVDKFRAKLSQILKIDPNDTEALDKALTLGNIEDKGPLVVKAIQEISNEMVKLGSKAKAVDDAFAISSKAYDTVTASLSPSDNLAKLGFSMIDLGTKMSEAFSSPVVALSQLAAISDDVSKLRFFDEKTASRFIKESSDIKETSNALVVYSKLLSDLKTEEEQLNISIAKDRAKNNPLEYHKTFAKEQKKEQIGAQRESLYEVVSSLQAKMKPLTDLLAKGVDASFVRGATFVANSIGIEFAKSGIVISKALSEGLGNTLGAIDQKARLDTESIDLQISQINTTIDLIKSNEKLISLQEETSLRMQQADILNKGNLTNEDRGKITDLGNKILAKIYGRENPISSLKEAIAGLKGEIVKTAPLSVVDKINSLNSGKIVNSEMVKTAAQGSLGAVQQTEASRAQLAALNAQKEAIAIDKKFKTMTELNNIDKDNLVTKQYSLNVTKAELDAISSNALYLSQETAMRKNAVTEQQALNTVELVNKDILLEKKKALEVLSKYAKGSKGYAEAQLSLDQIGTKLANKNSRDKEDSLIRQIGYQQALLAAKQAEIAFEIGMIKQREDAANLERHTQISIAEETQARFTALGAYTDEDISKLNTKIALEKEIQRSKEAQAILALNIASEQTSLGEKLAVLPAGDNPERKAIEDKMAANALFYTQAIAGETGLTAAKQSTIRVQGAMSALQAKQTEELSKMVSITESLSTVFGTLGESIGKAGEALLKMAQDDEKYAKNRAELEKTRDDGVSSAEAKEAAILGLDKLEKKAAKDKLVNIASVAGANKKMFAEHTVAYKVLGGIEKAAHTVKLAMQFQEMATDAIAFAKSMFFVQAEVPAVAAATAAKTGIELAGQAATMPAKIAGTYASFMSMLGPFGPPAAALAIAAFIGSAFGGSSGGSVSTGPSQEEMRAVQGTGQSYNSAGTLVDTGKGVFGDPTAVNNGIKESLDLLVDTAKPELAYTSKMVMLLANIDNSLSGAANSLTASGFKIDPASYASLGRTKESGIGNMGIPLVGNLVGKLLGNFGGSASSYFEVTGGGFEVAVQKLTDAVDNFISKGFVLTNKIASDGGIQAVRNPDEYGGRGTEVNTDFNAAMGRTLKEATIMAKEVAMSFGASSQEVDNTLNNFIINMGDIDLFGAKTLAEKSEILNAKIGGVIDDIIQQTLPKALSEFRKGGETLLTTAARVSSGIEEANFYLNQLGVTSIKYTDILRTQGDVSSEIVRQSIVLKEGVTGVGELIKLFSGSSAEISSFYTDLTNLRTIFENTGVSTNILTSQFLNLGGGLDKISGEVSDYYSNFYSEAERNLDSAKAISAKLAGVGLNYSPDEILNATKDQFRGVVEGLGTITPESQAAYVALMEVSDAFNTIAASTKANNALDIKLLELQGRAHEALALVRANEVKELTGHALQVQLAIYAQEDLNKTKDLETRLLTAQGNSYQVLLDSRAKELLGLSARDKAIKQDINTQEDLNKTKDLEIALLAAQGRGHQVLLANRGKELLALSDTDKAIKMVIHAQEDRNALDVLSTKLLTAQGKGYEVLLAARDKELAGLSPMARAIQVRIHEQEDLNKTENLTIQLLNAQKLPQEALNLSRSKELLALSATDAAIQKQIWHLEDYTKALADVESKTSAQTTALNAVEAIRNNATSKYEAALAAKTEAEKTIANITEDNANKAYEAAQKLRDLGKSLSDFVNGPDTKDFNKVLRDAMAGDEQAISDLPNVATGAIEKALQKASTAEEANIAKYSILSQVMAVANKLESTALPAKSAEKDPMVEAVANLTTANSEIVRALAVVTTIGAKTSTTIEDLITDYNSANTKLVEATSELLAAQNVLNSIKTNTGNTKDSVDSLKDKFSIELALSAATHVTDYLTIEATALTIAQRDAALSVMDNITKIISTQVTALTGVQRDNAVSVMNNITKTVDTLVRAVTGVQRDTALSIMDGITKTVSTAITSLTGTQRDNALSIMDGVTKTVSTAITSLTGVQRDTALSIMDGITKTVSTAITSLTGAQRDTALGIMDGITKTVNTSVTALTGTQRDTALSIMDGITKKVSTAITALTGAQRDAALSVMDGITKTVSTAITSLTGIQRDNALSIMDGVTKTIGIAVATLTGAQRDAALVVMDGITKTVSTAITSLTGAQRDNALSIMDGVTKTIGTAVTALTGVQRDNAISVMDGISKTVNTTVVSLTGAQRDTALAVMDGVTKTVNIAITSLTGVQRDNALSIMDNITKRVSVTAIALTSEQRDIALAAMDGITKTVNTAVTALTGVQRDAALTALDNIVKTVGLDARALTLAQADSALVVLNGISRTVGLGLTSLTSAQVATATAIADNLNKSVQLSAVGFSSVDNQTIANAIAAATKNIAIALDTSGPSAAAALALAAEQSEIITKTIAAAGGSLTTAQSILINQASDTIIKTFTAAGSGYLSPAQQVLVDQASEYITKTLQAAGSANLTYQQSLLLSYASDTIYRTFTAAGSGYLTPSQQVLVDEASETITKTLSVAGGSLSPSQDAILKAATASTAVTISGSVTWVAEKTLTDVFNAINESTKWTYYVWLTTGTMVTTLNDILRWCVNGGVKVRFERTAYTSGVWAKGGAFEQGTQAFAQGGTFTNSIVNKPTAFNMGLMGEAGPEAIMPLKRDKDGNLGVRAEMPMQANNSPVTLFTNNNQELIREIQKLREEVKSLRAETQAVAGHTAKSARLLDRAMPDGDSLAVTIIAV